MEGDPREIDIVVRVEGTKSDEVGLEEWTNGGRGGQVLVCGEGCLDYGGGTRS